MPLKHGAMMMKPIKWNKTNGDKEATMQQPFELPTYLDMIRKSPRQAAKEILSCAAILALMFAALYLKEILLWIEGVLP
jgi:hypothetical protein